METCPGLVGLSLVRRCLRATGGAADLSHVTASGNVSD